MNADEIASRLATHRIGRSLEVRASTASTNDDARLAAEAGAPDGHVVLADTQTAGRGSHGRAWSSPPGLDLYFSIVDRRPIASDVAALTTIAVGLAVAEAIEHASGVRALLKWPNDVLLNERKCAGILVETTTKGTEPGPRIIGVGVNVNRRELDPTFRATSIALEHRELDRVGLFVGLAASIERWLLRHQCVGRSIAGEARERLAFVGRPAHVGDVRGTIQGIDEDGALLLEREGTVTRVLSGRVEIDQ